MNEMARKLMTKLCNPNDQSLGKFKGLFIDTLVDSGDTIVELDDGWDQAGGAVHDFAEFLYKSIYTKQITKYPKFVEALPKKDEEDPWLDIKRVIDIFDHYISIVPTGPLLFILTRQILVVYIFG